MKVRADVTANATLFDSITFYVIDQIKAMKSSCLLLAMVTKNS